MSPPLIPTYKTRCNTALLQSIFSTCSDFFPCDCHWFGSENLLEDFFLGCMFFCWHHLSTFGTRDPAPLCFHLHGAPHAMQSALQTIHRALCRAEPPKDAAPFLLCTCLLGFLKRLLRHNGRWVSWPGIWLWHYPKCPFFPPGWQCGNRGIIPERGWVPVVTSSGLLTHSVSVMKGLRRAQAVSRW